MNISVKLFNNILKQLIIAFISISLLAGCVTIEENAVYNHGTIYSFLEEYPGRELPNGGRLSDADILLYSNSFAQLLRAKAENSRMAADTLTAFSQSLNLVTGASGTLAIAAADAALISFSNTTIPVFQKLFRTKDNPVAFRQAYSKVMQYKAEFQTANLPLWSHREPSSVLSQNGLILLTKTEAVVTELVAATNGELVSDDVQETGNQKMLPPEENKFIKLDKVDGLHSYSTGTTIAKTGPKKLDQRPDPYKKPTETLISWQQNALAVCKTLDDNKPETTEVTDGKEKKKLALSQIESVNAILDKEPTGAYEKPSNQNDRNALYARVKAATKSATVAQLPTRKKAFEDAVAEVLKKPYAQISE